MASCIESTNNFDKIGHTPYPWVLSSRILEERTLPPKKRMTGLALKDFDEVKIKFKLKIFVNKKPFVPQPVERPATRQHIKRTSPETTVTENRLQPPAKKPRLSEEKLKEKQEQIGIGTMQTLEKKKRGRKKKLKHRKHVSTEYLQKNFPKIRRRITVHVK